MMLHWARATCGMMGRSPDLDIVTYAAAWAGAADYFARGRPEFGANMRRYHEYIRENDLTLTHSLINLQRNGFRHVQPDRGHRPAGDPRRDRCRHRGARHARVLATLGPISDEIGVYSPRLGQHAQGHSPFALSFRHSYGTPGRRIPVP